MNKADETELFQRVAALEAGVKEFLGALRSMREVDANVRKLATECLGFLEDPEKAA